MGEDRSNIADYEEVLRVLSESALKDVWKDNPDVLVYLSELGSLGLHRLTQEPDRLAEEKVSVLEQTQDLAFHNYKTFIQAAECSQKIFQDFNIIEDRLDLLVNKLPIFKEKCVDFGKEAQQINARWKQASSTLSKHQQLLEFLEMPQLMDNYVKAGYYDEALELSAYVKRLERKHSDIPLIKSIIYDIQAAANSMLLQLLSKLQTNIQLPECLKIVGYLRRMDVFNEAELRIKFLQARDTWFKRVINDIDKSDTYQHVIKVIESSRIHLFDIITQYRAIFSDDDPLLLVNDASKSNCAIFHSWMTMKISWFLHTLEKDISCNLGGRIDSVFAQCMYFGLSFSRVNIDFRPLLVPIFQNAMFYKFQSEVDMATHKFSKTMVVYVFTSYTNTSLLVPDLSEHSLQPPNSLLDFHPLAQYCNDVLSALNDLKLCCSFSMISEVTKLLTESLDTLVKVLVGVFYQKKNIMNDEAKEHFCRFCLSLSSELVPHLNKCLSVLFPPEDISQVLGISSMEFKKFEYLCRLNSQAIMKPLEDVLPTTDEDEGLILNIKSSSQETEVSSVSVEDSVSNNAAESIKLQSASVEGIIQNNAAELIKLPISNNEENIIASVTKLALNENLSSELVEREQNSSEVIHTKNVSEEAGLEIEQNNKSIELPVSNDKEELIAVSIETNEVESDKNLSNEQICETEQNSSQLAVMQNILNETVVEIQQTNSEFSKLNFPEKNFESTATVATSEFSIEEMDDELDTSVK